MIWDYVAKSPRLASNISNPIISVSFVHDLMVMIRCQLNNANDGGIIWPS